MEQAEAAEDNEEVFEEDQADEGMNEEEDEAAGEEPMAN